MGRLAKLKRKAIKSANEEIWSAKRGNFVQERRGIMHKQPKTQQKTTYLT